MVLENGFVPLPSKEILSNVHLTAILNSNLALVVKCYSAVAYTSDGKILYGWTLNSPSKETLGDTIRNEQISTEILKPVEVDTAINIAAHSFKIIKANRKLAADLEGILQDKVADDPSANSKDNDLQLIRTYYGLNKEIMIIPKNDLLLTIVVCKVG